MSRDKHHSLKLQRAWNKYGENAFEFIVLQELGEDFNLILEIEQKYVNEYQSWKNEYGYNILSNVTLPPAKQLRDEESGFDDLDLENEEQVVCLKKFVTRGHISEETYHKLIRVMSVYGWDMSEGMSAAIAALWDKERQNVEAHEREKAEYFNVDTKEVRNKQFGIYKDRGRRKKANLQYKPSDEE